MRLEHGHFLDPFHEFLGTLIVLFVSRLPDSKNAIVDLWQKGSVIRLEGHLALAYLTYFQCRLLTAPKFGY